MLSESSREFLKKHQYIRTRSSYICEACIEQTLDLQQACHSSDKGASTSDQGIELVFEEADELDNSTNNTNNTIVNDHLKLISDCIESDLKELSKQGCPTLDDL